MMTDISLSTIERLKMDIGDIKVNPLATESRNHITSYWDF